jgi:hypothetical protein
LVSTGCSVSRLDKRLAPLAMALIASQLRGARLRHTKPGK